MPEELPRDLLGILSRLYETSASARTMIARVIDLERVVTDGTAMQVWTSGLRELYKQGKVGALVELACTDFAPHRERLQRALVEFERRPSVGRWSRLQSYLSRNRRRLVMGAACALAITALTFAVREHFPCIAARDLAGEATERPPEECDKNAIVSAAGLFHPGEDLRCAHGKYANLARTNLFGARLTCAQFDGADLREADISGATAEGTGFIAACLNRALLSDVVTDANTSFFRANLQSANFLSQKKGTKLEGVSFGLAQMQGIQLGGAKLARAKFKDGVIARGNFESADLTLATFENAQATNACFKKATIVDTDFTDADLSCSDFTGAIIRSAHFEGATLCGTRGLPMSFITANKLSSRTRQNCAPAMACMPKVCEIGARAQ